MLRESSADEQDGLLKDLSRCLSDEAWEQCRAIYASDRLMGWSQLKELDAAGVLIGAHTHNHVCISRCKDDAALSTELDKPRDILKRHGIQADFLAYPVGKRMDIGGRCFGAVAQAGYHTAFTTIPGRIKRNSHPLYYNRLPGQVEDLAVFKHILDRSAWDILKAEFW